MITDLRFRAESMPSSENELFTIRLSYRDLMDLRGVLNRVANGAPCDDRSLQQFCAMLRERLKSFMATL